LYQTLINRELPAHCPRRDTDPAMMTVLFITASVGVLAVSATFAVIIYIDARAERRHRQ